MSDSPALIHHPSAQTSFQPPLIANENAYLGDIASSDAVDDKSPISSGFFRLEKGTPLVYNYHYHEMKIILDGHFIITDGTGQKVKAVKGDVLYFPAGTQTTFETEDFGLAFYTGARTKDSA